MKRGNTRLVAALVVVAVIVAGIMVLLSQLDGGGSQDALAGIPRDGTTLGKKDAPVTIKLYEDFQCLACAMFARDTLPEVVERYVKPGEANLVSETMTFLGSDSVSTARVAIAAGEQDRYWRYALLLFENQGAENSGYVTGKFLNGLADQTEGLDVGKWRTARDESSVEKELKDVQKGAAKDGVQATPTLVISGPGGERTLRGAVPVDDVGAAIEEAKGT